ncbi:MAG: VanZ family protein [Planctomycetia bacterium]|nr:VanZ family protein [Planctomycetia bacterium]
MTRGTRTSLLAALAVGVLLTAPVPTRSRGVHALLDLAHAPVFGALALVVLRGGRAWLPRAPGPAGLAAWAVVVLFGAVMEFAQALSGRHPSWHDALANAMGAGAFLGFAAARAAPTLRSRSTAAAAGAALLAVPSAPPLATLADVAWQARDVPRLASFERPTELSRWEFAGSRAARSRGHATDGAWSLWLELGTGRYPAAPPRRAAGPDRTFRRRPGPRGASPRPRPGRASAILHGRPPCAEGPPPRRPPAPLRGDPPGFRGGHRPAQSGRGRRPCRMISGRG